MDDINNSDINETPKIHYPIVLVKNPITPKAEYTFRCPYGNTPIPIPAILVEIVCLMAAAISIKSKNKVVEGENND